MIQLVFSLLVGAGFLFLLYSFWRRDHSGAEGGAQALLDAQSAVSALQGDLLPPELIGRIFAKEDFEFVVSTTPAGIHELFLHERKKIAVSWVRQVRSQIVNLRRFHLGHSRFYARLSLRTELSLALEFSVLLLECRILEALLHFRGPYAFPRMVGGTVTAAARVCGVSAKSLSFLKIENPSTAGNGSARDGVAP